MSSSDIETLKIKMEVKPEDRINRRPTYKRIQEYVLQKYGVKVHAADIAQVKRVLGVDVKKANNRKTEEIANRPCSEEKAEIIKKVFMNWG